MPRRCSLTSAGQACVNSSRPGPEESAHDCYSNASLDLGDAAATLGLRLVYAIPWFGYGSVTGVLSVHPPGTEPFTAGQVGNLGVLAHFLAASKVVRELAAKTSSLSQSQ